MVLNVVPRLPQLPALKGKFIKPFYSLFRSPDRPDCNNVSMVGVPDPQRSTNICRFEFNLAAVTPRSIDPIGTLWSI